MKTLILLTFIKKIFTHLVHKAASKSLFLFYFKKINKSNNGIIISLHRTTEAGVENRGLNSFIEISSSNLEKTIVYLKSLDATFVPLHKVGMMLDTKQEKPLIHISFDDGYADTFTNAFPILKKHNVCFSIFPVSDYISNGQPFLWWYLLEDIVTGKKNISFEKYEYVISEKNYTALSDENIFEDAREFIMNHIDEDREYFEQKLCEVSESALCVPATLTKEMINEMMASGLCDIGAHTQTHARFSKLTYEQQAAEIRASQKDIFKHTGKMPEYFVYPYGDKKDIGNVRHLERLMKECGIKAAFTTSETEINHTVNKYLMPRLFLNNYATEYTLKTRLTGAYQRMALPGQ